MTKQHLPVEMQRHLTTWQGGDHLELGQGGVPGQGPGEEAAIAIHLVNNLLRLLPVPWMGLEGIFDRGEGVAGPWILIDFAVLGIVAVVIDALARRRGLPTETAPGVLSAVA